MKFSRKYGMWRWVAASLMAVAGSVHAETEIEIQGLKGRSESEVLALMGDRLEYVRAKQASASRANDAAFLVKQILQNDGHTDVSVASRVVGKGRILLVVNEGERLRLGEVKVEGDGDAERLAALFSLPANKNVKLAAGKAPFREEDVETGLVYLQQELNSQGYWNATAVLRKQETDKENGLVNIGIDVDQGQRFKIGRGTVKSDGRGVKRVATTLEPFLGEWATTEQINGLRAAMTEAFVSRGYPDAKILMNRRLEGSTYRVDFEIDLGTRVKLLNVHAEGLKKTKQKRVDQITASLEGDWYDQAAMNKKLRELLATGAFSSARIETYEVAKKRIDATLHFQEAKAKEITLSAGAGSFTGPLFRAGYIDRNFRGDLRGFSAGMELSGRGALGEVKLTDPWWLGTDVALDLRLYSLIYGYDGYSSFETGLESAWTWKLTDHYSMKFLLGYSFVTVAEDGLATALLGETNYGHTRFSFTQTWDYRDSPVLPKSGWHVSVPIQFGAAIGNVTSTYASVGLDGGWYLPLGETYQLGVGGFANWISPSGSVQDLPVDLRVFNGGARSVRSFPERELGPSFGGNPYGGDFSWALNTEVSRKITGAVSAVAFVDAGAVTGNYVGVRQGGLELAAGLGVRIELPVGPVRLEYGHNLTQDAGEPGGTWHFAIGATF